MHIKCKHFAHTAFCFRLYSTFYGFSDFFHKKRLTNSLINCIIISNTECEVILPMKKSLLRRFGILSTALLYAFSLSSAALPTLSFDVEHTEDPVGQTGASLMYELDLELPEALDELPVSREEEKELLAADTNDASLLTAPFEGKGTEASPYLIKTASELRLFSSFVRSGNSEYVDAHYALAADIDLSGAHWTPVGIYSSGTKPYAAAFSGTFDGCGYTVSDFRITADTRHLGFFGLTYNASIKNFTISNFTLEVSSEAARPFYVGGLVGRFLAVDGAQTVIENCHVTDASIDISGTKYSVYAGGLAGSLHASDGAVITVSGCDTDADISASLRGYATNDITSSFNVYAGGFVGYVGARTENADGGTVEVFSCYATGSVCADSTVDYIPSSNNLKAGGFFGYLGSSSDSEVSVHECYSLGTVTSSAVAENYSGSFLGYMIASTTSSAIVENCYTASGVYAASSENEAYLSGFTSIAGETGSSTVRVKNCYTSGNIVNTAPTGLLDKLSYGGKMVAYRLGNTEFTNCYVHDDAFLHCEELYDNTFATSLDTESACALASYIGFASDEWENGTAPYAFPTLKAVAHRNIPLTVTFMDGSSVFSSQDDLHYGDIATFPTETPSSKYLFSHWSLTPNGEAVTEHPLRCDTVFYPNYSDTLRTFTVSFSADGSVFHTEELSYGATVTFPQAPEKAADQIYRYTFSHWSTTEKGESDCENVTVSADTTYYAVYKKTAVGSWDGVTAAAFEAGDGTKENPYQIRDAYNLYYLSKNIASEGYASAYYVLTRDIDLGSFPWTPIGTEETPFAGVFDGAGYEITGLNLSDHTFVDIGLFGYMAGATVRKLALSDFTLQIESNDAQTIYVGALVGRIYVRGKGNAAEISECSVNGELSIRVSTVAYVGGLAGRVEAGQGAFIYIEDSLMSGAITVAAEVNLYVGGITGYYHGTSEGISGIDRCYSDCTLTATSVSGSTLGTAYTGGIVGSLVDDEAYIDAEAYLAAADRGTLRNCFVRGTVDSTAAIYTNFVGKLYGRINTIATVSNCAASAQMLFETHGSKTIINDANIAEVDDAELCTEAFLQTLGFDTESVWTLRENALPILSFAALEKNIYRIKSFDYDSETDTLTASFLISYRDVSSYSVLAGAYDARGKMVGFTMKKVDTATVPTDIDLSLANVGSAVSYIVSVIDSATFELIEDPLSLTKQ